MAVAVEIDAENLLSDERARTTLGLEKTGLFGCLGSRTRRTQCGLLILLEID